MINHLYDPVDIIVGLPLRSFWSKASFTLLSFIVNSIFSFTFSSATESFRMMEPILEGAPKGNIISFDRSLPKLFSPCLSQYNPARLSHPASFLRFCTLLLCQFEISEA
jgi:hypothetical protein